jgi:hypothetical protein
VNVAFSLIELEHTGQAVFGPYFCKWLKIRQIEFSLFCERLAKLLKNRQRASHGPHFEGYFWRLTCSVGLRMVDKDQLPPFCRIVRIAPPDEGIPEQKIGGFSSCSA